MHQQWGEREKMLVIEQSTMFTQEKFTVCQFQNSKFQPCNVQMCLKSLIIKSDNWNRSCCQDKTSSFNTIYGLMGFYAVWPF